MPMIRVVFLGLAATELQKDFFFCTVRPRLSDGLFAHLLQVRETVKVRVRVPQAVQITVRRWLERGCLQVRIGYHDFHQNSCLPNGIPCLIDKIPCLSTVFVSAGRKIVFVGRNTVPAASYYSSG